jgi:hypothetical protein
MQNKRNTTKLVLSSTTLRNLTTADLIQAVGGHIQTRGGCTQKNSGCNKCPELTM